MAHKTRTELPKQWPLPRSGSAYFAVGSHETNKGIPLIIVLRNILKLVKTRREARFMILNGNIKVNQKIRKNEKFPICLFDTLNIEKIGKNYVLGLKGKKFQFEEISAKESCSKIVKIIGKRKIGDKKVQINLIDGKNFLTTEKFCFGDSAVVNLKENKIEKIIPLKEGVKVKFICGKHS